MFGIMTLGQSIRVRVPSVQNRCPQNLFSEKPHLGYPFLICYSCALKQSRNVIEN